MQSPPHNFCKFLHLVSSCLSASMLSSPGLLTPKQPAKLSLLVSARSSTTASSPDCFVDVIQLQHRDIPQVQTPLHSLFSPHHSGVINKSLLPSLIRATMPIPRPLGFSSTTSKDLLENFFQTYTVVLQEEFWRIFSPFIAWQYAIILDHDIRSLFGVFQFSIYLEPDQSVLCAFFFCFFTQSSLFPTLSS